MLVRVRRKHGKIYSKHTCARMGARRGQGGKKLRIVIYNRRKKNKEENVNGIQNIIGKQTGPWYLDDK